MRKTLLPKMLLLLCALMAGSVSVWADETGSVKYTVAGKTSVTANKTIDGVTVSFANTDTNNNDQLTNGKTMTLTLKGFPYEVNSITLHLKRNASKGSGTVKVTVGSSTFAEETYSTSDLTNSYTDYTINGTAASGDVTILLTSTANSFWCDYFQINYTIKSDPSDTRSDCPITLDKTELDLDVYSNATATLTPTSVSTGAITWSSSDETVATVVDGVVTALKAGTATITASQEGDDEYKDGSATCELTVTDSTPFTGGDITFTASTDGASGTSFTKSVVTVSTTSGNFTSNDYRFYASSTATISTTLGKITSIVFTCSSSNPASNFTVKNNNGSLSTNGNNGTWTGESNSVSFTASSQVRATQIVVTVEADKKATTITLSTAALNLDLNGATSVSGDLTATLKDADDNVLDKTLTVTPSEGLTYADGKVTATAVGSYTVTFGFAGDTGYKAAEDAVATVTVKNSAVVEAPVFSVASSAVYYGTQVTLTQDDATMIVYTTDGNDPTADFEGEEQEYEGPITITEDVTIKAIALDSNGKASEVVTATYTVKAPEAPTYSVAGDVTAGTTVTLTAGEGGEIVVYTTDGSDPTIASEIYTAPIAINYAQTIKAATVDDGDNLSSIASADYAIVIVNSGTLWEEDFTGQTENKHASNDTYSYVCTDGDSGTNVKNEDLAGGSVPELLVGKKNGAFTATIPLNNVAGTLTLTWKANYDRLSVSSTTKGVSVSAVTFDDSAKAGSVTITGVTSDMTSLVIKFTNTNSSSNVRLDDIKLTYNEVVRTEKVVVTAAEYATYYSAANALDFSGTGITVYTATDNETSVSLNEVTSGKVPAGTAVVLYKEGADGTPVNVPVATSAAAVEGTNDLHVVGEGGLTGEDNIYVLAKKNGKVGFYLWDKTATLNEGKIYLQGKATYGAREFLGFDDNGTTSVNEELGMKNDEFANAPVFNLNGQRVSQPTKGLYIVDGRKVVIR